MTEPVKLVRTAQLLEDLAQEVRIITGRSGQLAITMRMAVRELDRLALLIVPQQDERQPMLRQGIDNLMRALLATLGGTKRAPGDPGDDGGCF